MTIGTNPSGFKSGKSFGHEKLRFRNGRVRPASFICYKEEKGLTYERQGRRVYQIEYESKKISDAGILQLLDVTSCPEKKMHFIFYEKFDRFLFGNWFKNHPNGMRDQHGDIKPWVQDSIRDVMVTIKNMLNRRLLHSGLGDLKNYVIAEGKIKIINIMSSWEDLVDPQKLKNGEDVQTLVGKRSLNSLTRKEITSVKKLWQTLLKSDNAWPERDYFLSIFDQNLHPWDVHIEKIITHPFLKTSEGRVKYFSEIHRQHMTDSIPRPDVFYKAIRNHFGKYRGTINSVNMSRQLKALYTSDTYGKPITYGNTILGLLRFLRNAYEHRGADFPVCDLDREIRKHWPGFLEKLHEKL
ncbi:hypothetical protein RchiOBHm_Chr7g0205701 [Rosa chinensis]|uniref:KEN domain-containing protein n=1 Tax=Rosa chinensis TaxID=74649 RepID=A0A2P6P925_ROSCH|nr:uncharacterized protein LOC112180747 [Rosa chinensis]XP_040365886.1 uncharacterized protein LOC112180747 [Rosa chinensis]XP_040365887.1 uncharacterized protein LOC112180747 [Rosa chinensis]PRQ18407.1 hypothetical protein RchiOBHm_Chr7g0205701 [Rosa chinensis]